jgi:hypothetical protein
MNELLPIGNAYGTSFLDVLKIISIISLKKTGHCERSVATSFSLVNLHLFQNQNATAFSRGILNISSQVGVPHQPDRLNPWSW